MMEVKVVLSLAEVLSITSITSCGMLHSREDRDNSEVNILSYIGQYCFLYLILSPPFFEGRVQRLSIYWLPSEATKLVNTWKTFRAEEI